MSTAFVTLDPTTCANCGVTFGLDANFEAKRREDRKTFYCPNGHALSFKGKSELERRAEKAEAEARTAKAEATHERQRRENAEREANVQKHRARGLKGAQTRLKKRVACGVCPCCRRSFENLRRHMATKHPKFGKPDAAGPLP